MAHTQKRKPIRGKGPEPRSLCTQTENLLHAHSPQRPAWSGQGVGSIVGSPPKPSSTKTHRPLVAPHQSLSQGEVLKQLGTQPRLWLPQGWEAAHRPGSSDDILLAFSSLALVGFDKNLRTDKSLFVQRQRATASDPPREGRPRNTRPVMGGLLHGPAFSVPGRGPHGSVGAARGGWRQTDRQTDTVTVGWHEDDGRNP